VTSMADGKKTFGSLVLVLALPLYAVYGAWIVVTILFRLVRWFVWTVRLARGHLRCPACGLVNSILGRWECHAPGCGAVYVGAADHCARCHSAASYVPCVGCGASISLRPSR
jgi:hypothetical protein